MRYLDDDIIDLVRADGSTWQFYWGDKVDILETTAHAIKVAVHGRFGKVDEGFISSKTNFRDTPLLRMSMIDVQQGDGIIIETADDKVIFIDGGDNQLFARHAAARFRGSSAANPLIVDAMIITHGDADHFDGLSELRRSETHTTPSKRIFVAPARIYHNGLVKRPGKDGTRDRRDVEMFGATQEVDGKLYATGLVEDPATVPASERNRNFNTWVQTLDAWRPRVQQATGAAMQVERLDHLSVNAFDFLAGSQVAVEILGPITRQIGGLPALEFLRAPPKDAELMLGMIPPSKWGGYSASHTINGHSLNFRLRVGNVRFMFTGDMNQEAMQRMREAMPAAALRSEILKTPHHGSADFDMEFLKEVGAVVSLISSGDESAAKEYIHPRATLMAALGRASRTTPAIIFCTELAAFFATKGYVDDPKKTGRQFYAFERTNFGIAHVRTDGHRVLAFTHSGKKGMNEAYRFTVSPTGEIAFSSDAVKRSAPKLA